MNTMGDTDIIFEGDSDYGHYQVVDTIYSGRRARVLYSGNHAAAQSGVAQDDNEELLFDYNQRFLELIRGVKSKKLLLLGGGAFTLPIALAHELPKLKLDVVELDGGLLDIAQQHFGYQPTKYTEIYIGDGLQFIEQTHSTYDIILLDVYTDASIPSQFTTFEAAETLQRCLSKDGVLAMNVISAFQGVRSGVLRRLHESLLASFKTVEIYPASYGQSIWLGQNFVVTAHNADVHLEDYLRYEQLKLT